MSTIHLRPTHLNLWWYAAAAVLAGAVLVLITLTLRNAGSGPESLTDTTGTTTTHFHHYQAFGCHAGHPVPNIELGSCVTPVR